MPAATPTPERLTAVLAQVHKTVAAEDDDLVLDPALSPAVRLNESRVRGRVYMIDGTPGVRFQ